MSYMERMLGWFSAADRASLLLEAAQAVGVGSKRRGKNFHRYRAVKTGILCAVNFSHAAGAQRSLNFVGTDFCARGQRHQRAL